MMRLFEFLVIVTGVAAMHWLMVLYGIDFWLPGGQISHQKPRHSSRTITATKEIAAITSAQKNTSRGPATGLKAKGRDGPRSTVKS